MTRKPRSARSYTEDYFYMGNWNTSIRLQFNLNCLALARLPWDWVRYLDVFCRNDTRRIHYGNAKHPWCSYHDATSFEEIYEHTLARSLDLFLGTGNAVLNEIPNKTRRSRMNNEIFTSRHVLRFTVLMETSWLTEYVTGDSRWAPWYPECLHLVLHARSKAQI